jgi:two-component system, chemotaxis family, chemotaxis protein CheY
MKVDSGFDHLHVLVVDDERAVIKILRNMLANIGITQIMVAHDGLEASKFLEDCGDKINLIICDWNMPHMNGFDLLRKVRKSDPHKAFVMLTGFATHDILREAKQLNVTAFIAKPFSHDEIRKKLELVARNIPRSRAGDGSWAAAGR